MTRLLHPSLKELMRIGFVDFYILLAVGVCLVIPVPDRIMPIIASLAAGIFTLSALLTICGMTLNRLYHEAETYSILVLQLAFIFLFMGLR